MTNDHSHPITLPDYAPTLPEMLRRIVAEHGDLECVVRGDARITYKELDTRSAHMARGLLASGARKGSRVAILMPNSPDWITVFMAAARIGAIVVPLSTLYQAPELKWVLRHADIDTLFIANRFLNHDYVARLEEAFPSLKSHKSPRLFLPEAPFLRSIYVFGAGDRPWAHDGAAALMRAADAQPQISADYLAQIENNVSPADLFFMIYTSGSTADPKGVVHTHGNVIRHTYQMSRDYCLLAPGERFANARPWFWIAGLCAVLIYTLHNGACVVIPETDDPGAMPDLFTRERITFIGGLPPFFTAITAHPAVQESPYRLVQIANNTCGIAIKTGDGEHDLRFASERLEKIIQASAPVEPGHFGSFYGMTETLGAHTAEPPPTRITVGKEGASGRPIPGVIHKIIDPDTGEPVPSATPGEMSVKGYSLMAGFYKKEREETFEPDGFYQSGDICDADTEGYVTVHNRLDDMVKISGANVAPLEVERALVTLDGVQECAVIGLKEEGRAPTLIAAIIPVLGSGLRTEDITAALKTKLSSYKVPKQIILMDHDAVPRTGSGKIQKTQLKDLLRKQLTTPAP